MIKKIFYYLIVILFTCSCTGDRNLTNELDNETPNNPQNNIPPDNFSVKIDSITHESAFLSWDKANDFENDEIKYDVVLNGSTLLMNSTKLELKINNLNELTNYIGKVVAKDTSGNITSTDFTFTTVKYYLRYLKKYGFPQTNYGGLANQVLKLRDNSFLILGKNNAQGVGSKLNVTKIDISGNLIWNKLLPVEYLGNVAGSNMKMIQCANSNNIIIGAGRNVTKIDFDGNIIWVKFLNSFNDNWSTSGIESLVENSSNEIYVVGHAKSTNAHKHAAGHLTKLNSNGIIIFEKVFENAFNTEFKEIIIDGPKLVIFGTKEISGITWDQYLANQTLQVKFNILYTDLNGNYINEKNYNDPGYAFAMGFFKKSNGNYIFYGYSAIADYTTGIYEVNSNGDLIWKKNYPSYGSISSLKETPNGNLVAIAMQSGYYYTRTFIYLLDPIGNDIWNKNFYEMGQDFFGRDILPDEDGGYRFLITHGKGYKMNPEDYGVIHLYKTDPDGNF